MPKETPEEISAMIEKAKLITPTAGRCLVERDKFAYSGLLYIPEKHRQMPTTGRVVGVGDDTHDYLLGKRVVWGRFSGVPIQFDKWPTYDVLSYDEIIGYITDETVELKMEDLSGLNRAD